MGIFSKKKTEDNQKAKEAATEQTGTGKHKDESAAQSGSDQGKQSMKDLYTEEKAKGEAKAKTKAKAAKPGKKKPAKTPVRAYRVLLRPVITEKAADQGVLNKYVFEVAKNANKIDVSKAVEEVYGVRPKAVNVVSMRGKNVRFGRIRGRRSDWKKAVVTLPEGKSISIYEGV